MILESEGEAERARRRYQRGLFDGVARLHEAPLEASATMAPVFGAVAGG